MSDYDEEAEISRYIWRFSLQFMTELEIRADRAAMVRSKAASATRLGARDHAKVLLEQSGFLGNPEVEVALAEGHDAFRRRVARRLQTDPTAATTIKRCPRCQRIVRTPTAKQCFWCGCDWHDF